MNEEKRPRTLGWPRPDGAEERFLRTFGVDLSGFWDSLTGFDLVAFDRWLAVPEGRSPSSVVKERYGDDAVRFLLDVILHPPPRQ